MRRLLYGVVAAQLVLASLGVAVVARSTRAEPVALAPAAADDIRFAGSAVGGTRETDARPHQGGLSATGSRMVGARPWPRGQFGERQSSGAKQIWFASPVDFATGPVPTSTAFNAASGDQMHLVLARTPLSDSVAVGDFNHDRKPDVAQTNVIAGTLSVFLGDGRGGFGSPQQHPVGVHPVFVVAGDLDVDGHLDLAVANFGSNSVSILRGVGDGGFRPAQMIAVPTPRNIAIGNYNGDKLPDLAVASSGPGRGTLVTKNEPTAGSVVVLLGGEGGSYGVTQRIDTTSADGQPINANYVAAGDFDSDGRDDLAVGVGISSNAGDVQAGDTRRTGDDVIVFLSRARPRGVTQEQPFSGAAQQRVRVGSWPVAIAVADLNGDTDPDLAVLDSSSGDVTTLLGNGEGSFVVRATNTTVGALPRSLAIADFNDDGLLDLVTASFMASTVSVLAGEGGGTFRPAVDFWAGDAPTGTAVGDFDGDGRVDVVVGRTRTDHLAFLRNDSPQSGDGVVVTRDISYGSPTHPTNDPFAAHHTLDVYTPPRGTTSFAGLERAYPVVFFVHGGGGISGDKSMVSFLMRSLALDGIVAVSANYRLGPGIADDQMKIDQAKDVAQAFRWTRDNVGTRAFGGDPNNLFAFGHSHGAVMAATLGVGEQYRAERRSIRAMVLVSLPGSKPAAGGDQPPSRVLIGTEGLELILLGPAAAFAAHSRAVGADSEHVVVPGRDHLTILSDMALAGDPARAEMVGLLRAHLSLDP